MGAAASGGRRGRGALAGVLAIGCLLIAPGVVRAEELSATVNSTSDATAAEPSVGCASPGETCTLRAAIEEIDASAGEGQITFDEATFAGHAGDAIVLSTGLPAITVPIFINGHNCSTDAGVIGPCVDVDGPAGGTALTVAGAAGVNIEGLAVTGAKVGISVQGSPSFRAQRDWFGVELDGSAGGDETGILLGSGSTGAQIGSASPEFNLFGNSAEVGLAIAGASEARVLGNRFGVGTDGSTPAPNGTDIRIAGAGSSGDTIGARVKSVFVSTPQCDGGCNLISGAVSNGIELSGAGAAATTVIGNAVGLDETGTAVVANGSAGISVAEAPETVIGGPRSSEANRIAGGAVAISAIKAPSLAIRGNGIGSEAVAAVGAPPTDGIAVDSTGLTKRLQEAAIVGNQIGVGGGVAISQKASGALISGNYVTGAQTGIKTFESTGQRGNVIEANVVEAVTGDGILLQNNLNVVAGNAISAAGAAGIHVLGALPSLGPKENLLGGDAPARENLVNHSGGAAIEITDRSSSNNEVARNRGSGNAGLFIELTALDPSTESGPNNGIQPPAITTATATSASGTGQAQARVRVFRKQSSSAGEVESFLSEAIVDAEGNWSVSYPALPPGTAVAATQTTVAGGTSEMGVAGTPAEPATPPAATPTPARVPPSTRIVKGPHRRSDRRTARFAFASDEAGSSFQCKLDKGGFRPCGSPRIYRHLKPGSHVFEVRAVDTAGDADPTPAIQKFRVLARR